MVEEAAAATTSVAVWSPGAEPLIRQLTALAVAFLRLRCKFHRVNRQNIAARLVKTDSRGDEFA